MCREPLSIWMLGTQIDITFLHKGAQFLKFLLIKAGSEPAHSNLARGQKIGKWKMEVGHGVGNPSKPSLLNLPNDATFL